MYMNRLLLEGENLILGKKKTSNNHLNLMYNLHTPLHRDHDDLDQIDDKDKDLEFKVTKLD